MRHSYIVASQRRLIPNMANGRETPENLRVWYNLSVALRRVNRNRILSTPLQKEKPAISGKAKRASVHLVISRWMILLLAAAIVTPWLVLASLLASGHAVQANSRSSPATAAPVAAESVSDTTPAELPPQVWVAGKEGPWGRIDSMLFTLDVPPDCVLGSPAPPVRWSFPGYTKEKVLATLRSVGVPEAEVKKLDGSATWSSAGGLASVEPGDPLILGLAPKVRSELYAILVEFPQNAQHIEPIWFRAGNVDWRLQDSGLAPQSVALLKRLLYPQGEDSLFFADSAAALRNLPNDAERIRFMRAILRKRAVLARVRLEPDSDVEKLSQYWGIGGQRKDLLPFLSALHRVEKGCKVNVVYFLPNFARERLYLYPSAVANDKSVTQDCFWSAYNFFNDPPDNSLADTHSIAGLNKSCYQISSPNQLGDLVLLTTHDGSPVHAAVFLADDIYFTKNGQNRTQPWILMHLADLLEEYHILHPNGGLDIHYFRRNGL